MLKQIKPELLEKTESSDGIYVEVTIYNRVMQPNTTRLLGKLHKILFLAYIYRYIFFHIYPQLCFIVAAVNVLVKSLSS